MSTPASVSAEIQRIRSATYTGRDPANLATAVVDGQAQLVRVTFATTVGMHPPQAVEDAVADAKRLAAVEIEASSPDRRVRVKVTATGAITEFRLLDNVLRRYDTNALGELVTRTVREAQRKALQTYE